MKIITTRQAIYRLLLNHHAGWHGCRLKEAERGMRKGTPCDSCKENARIYAKLFAESRRVKP